MVNESGDVLFNSAMEIVGGFVFQMLTRASRVLSRTRCFSSTSKFQRQSTWPALAVYQSVKLSLVQPVACLLLATNGNKGINQFFIHLNSDVSGHKTSLRCTHLKLCKPRGPPTRRHQSVTETAHLFTLILISVILSRHAFTWPCIDD